MQENKFDIKTGYIQLVKLYASIMYWMADDINEGSTTICHPNNKIISDERISKTLCESNNLLNKYNYTGGEISVDSHNATLETSFQIFTHIYGSIILSLSDDNPLHLWLHKTEKLNINDAYADIKYMVRNLLGVILGSIIKKETIISRFEDDVTQTLSSDEAQQELLKLGNLNDSRNYEMIPNTEVAHDRFFNLMCNIALRFNATPRDAFAYDLEDIRY